MTAATPRRRPPGRYDQPSLLGARITAVLLSALFLAFLLGLAVVLYTRYFTDQVRADVVRFEVVSDELVRVDLRVLKPLDGVAYCYVRSRAPDGSEVGRVLLVVREQDELVRRDVEVPTRARGTTGEVGRCSTEPLPAP